MKPIICIILLTFVLGGCKEKEAKWEKVIEAKVITIEIVGVGGWGSPNSCRVWRLDNGMTVSMSGWKNEDVAVGDSVVKYKQVVGPNKGRTIWQKKAIKMVERASQH